MLNSRPKIQLKKIPLVSSKTSSIITSDSKKKIPLIPKKKESIPISSNNTEIISDDNKESMLVPAVVEKELTTTEDKEQAVIISENNPEDNSEDNSEDNDHVVVHEDKDHITVFNKNQIELSENNHGEIDTILPDQQIVENKPKITLKKKEVNPPKLNQSIKPTKTVGLPNNIHISSNDNNISLENMRKRKIGTHFYWFSKEGDIYDSDAEKIGKLKPNDKILWY